MKPCATCFFAHGLLVVPGQSLSLEQQQEVVACIGPVLRGERGLAHVAPDDGILNDSRLTYHSDLAFAPEPFTALSLHAVDVEDDQTSTLFADAARASESLTGSLKSAIRDRQAVFVASVRFDRRMMDLGIQHGRHALVRPAVLTHPVTQKPVLFVNEQHVERIEGLPAAESRALLEGLFGHLYAPTNIFEHRWRSGDLLVWDNLALQHGRAELAGVRRRKLQRAAVANRSLLEQIPTFSEARAEDQ